MGHVGGGSERKEVGQVVCPIVVSAVTFVVYYDLILSLKEAMSQVVVFGREQTIQHHRAALDHLDRHEVDGDRGVS